MSHAGTAGLPKPSASLRAHEKGKGGREATFVLVNLTIDDPVGYHAEYGRHMPELLKGFGGEVLVADDQPEIPPRRARGPRILASPG